MSTSLTLLNENSPAPYTGRRPNLSQLKNAPNYALTNTTNAYSDNNLTAVAGGPTKEKQLQASIQNKLEQLKIDLKQAKGKPEQVAKIGMKALKEIGELAPKSAGVLAPIVVDTVFKNTEGADKAKFISEMSKENPRFAGDMIASLKPDFKGADLSAMDPKDAQSIISHGVQIAGAKFPVGMDLSGKDLRTIDMGGCKMPGAIIAGAKGPPANVKGLDFSGGKDDPSDPVSRKNAAVALSWGDGVVIGNKFQMTNSLGTAPISLNQAMSNGRGVEGIEAALMPAGMKKTATHYANLAKSGPTPFGNAHGA